MHVKTGDKVKVLAGKDKGKEGVITKAFPKKDRVIVEGVNVVKKHTKPSNTNPSGGIVEKEAPYIGEDGQWHIPEDYDLWVEDENTRYEEAVANGWEIPW